MVSKSQGDNRSVPWDPDLGHPALERDGESGTGGTSALRAGVPRCVVIGSRSIDAEEEP